MEGLGSLIFAIVLIAIGVVGKKEVIKGGAKKPAQTSAPKAEAPERPQTPKHPEHPYAPSTPKQQRTFTPEAQERRYYDSDCETAMSEHDHDRRMEQLNDFLKSGIIGREEYQILKERYSR